MKKLICIFLLILTPSLLIADNLELKLNKVSLMDQDSNFFDSFPDKKGKIVACFRNSKGKVLAGKRNKKGKWQSFKSINKKKLKKAKKKNPDKFIKLRKKLKKKLKKLNKQCKTADRCTVTANPQSVNVDENSSKAIVLNVTSTCEDSLSYTLIAQPSLGSLTGNIPQLSYSVGHEIGTTSFEYTVRNTVGKESSAVVSINIKSLGASFVGNSTSLASYRQNITPAEARHLLKRVAFGATEQLVAQSQTMNLDDFVNLLLTNSGVSNLAAIENQALNVSESRRDDVVIDFDIDGNGSRETRYRLNDHEWTTSAARYYWHYLMRYGHAVNERMAFLLHDHLATGLDQFSGSFDAHQAIINHIELLRGHSLGRFDNLISNLHWDLAMAYWLDNRFNTVYEPNENYGRELLELFTLGTVDTITGIPNYNEADMFASTRAISGFEVHDEFPETLTLLLDPEHSSNAPGAPATQDFTYTPERVDWSAAKWMIDPNNPENISIFSGTPYSENSAMNFDSLTNVILYQHPGSARFIASKLFARLVHPEPTEEIVQELASLLIANQYDLKPVLRKLMTSSAMFSNVRYNCISSPVEAFMTFFRTLNLPFEEVNGDNLIGVFDNAILDAGQRTLSPPTVFGWKGCGVNRDGNISVGEPWLSAQALLERQKNIVSILNELDDYYNSNGIPWETLLPTANATSDQVITHLSTLMGIVLSPAERSLMRNYLNNAVTSLGSNQSNADWTIDAVTWDPADTDMVRLKIPGLLSILFAHPNFQSR